MLWREAMPARHLCHNSARRIGFRHDPSLELLAPATPSPHADLDLNPAPWLRHVKYMVDHICEPICKRWIVSCWSARGRQGGDKRPLTSYPRQFFRIYGKGLRADRALRAAGIEPIKHPDIGEQFWHQMLIDDIVMSFEIACKTHGLPFKDQYEILGQKPLELPCHVKFTFPSSGVSHTSDKALCPDCAFQAIVITDSRAS